MRQIGPMRKYWVSKNILHIQAKMSFVVSIRVFLFLMPSLAISCDAHTLQLAIQDALKNTWNDVAAETYVEQIKLGRQLAVAL